MTTIIDTPDGMEFFKMAQASGRLSLELKGLRFRQPTLRHVREYYGIKVKTKREAFELLDAAKARVLEGANIWREIARLRGAVVFASCTHCGWQGDETTLGTFDGRWYCPKCKQDESAIELEKMGD